MVLKKEKNPETGFLFFFFLMIVTFFKSIVILIITSPAIDYSQNVFRVFSILVCIGVQVFFYGFFFFTLPLARDSLSRLPLFDRKTLKNCTCSADPGLLNETKGSWFPFFLSFFISKRMVKTDFFLITASTLR